MLIGDIPKKNSYRNRESLCKIATSTANVLTKIPK